MRHKRVMAKGTCAICDKPCIIENVVFREWIKSTAFHSGTKNHKWKTATAENTFAKGLREMFKKVVGSTTKPNSE
jgi:hypothetical protein